MLNFQRRTSKFRAPRLRKRSMWPGFLQCSRVKFSQHPVYNQQWAKWTEIPFALQSGQFENRRLRVTNALYTCHQPFWRRKCFVSWFSPTCSILTCRAAIWERTTSDPRPLAHLIAKRHCACQWRFVDHCASPSEFTSPPKAFFR